MNACNRALLNIFNALEGVGAVNPFHVQISRTYPGPTATPSQRPLFSIFGTSTIIMAADNYNTRLEAALAELAL